MGYLNAVRNIWRQNIFLLIMTFGLLIVTSSYWLGIPIYIIGQWLYRIGFPDQLKIFIITFCICVLISLYLIPFHIEVAREMGGSLWRQLWRIEWRFVLILSVSCIIFILTI